MSLFNVYVAGHMLTKGAQMQRKQEVDDLKAVSDCIAFYVPQNNKEINDKQNANQEGLAERIVKHDTDAIMWSDTVVIEPLPEALGTHVELGQLKGMLDVARLWEHLSAETKGKDLVDVFNAEMQRILTRKVYPHYEDIRRVEGITEAGDRRSLGINQYVYGTCLDLTHGRGFYNWDEIVNEIKEEHKNIPF